MERGEREKRGVGAERVLNGACARFVKTTKPRVACRDDFRPQQGLLPSDFVAQGVLCHRSSEWRRGCRREERKLWRSRRRSPRPEQRAGCLFPRIERDVLRALFREWCQCEEESVFVSSDEMTLTGKESVASILETWIGQNRNCEANVRWVAREKRARIFRSCRALREST